MNWPKQRAWGWYATLIRTPWFCLKLLRFKSGGILSVQRHFHRTEIWLFIRGHGYINNGYYGGSWGNDVGEIWKIKKGSWHQFRAPKEPVYAIEFQYGKKVTELDIERK